MAECPNCDGEGVVLDAVSPYSQTHAYPQWVACPVCDRTGEVPDDTPASPRKESDA